MLQEQDLGQDNVDWIKRVAMAPVTGAKYASDQPRDDHGRFGSGGTVEAPASGDRLAALTRYRAGGYDVINSTLRGTPIETTDDSMTQDDMKAVGGYVAAIDAAMQPLPASTVYRGLSTAAVGALLEMPSTGVESGPTYDAVEAMSNDELSQSLQNLVGTTFEDKGFVSTTTDPYEAGTRATLGRVEVELSVPAGVKGVDMNEQVPGSAFASEKEILLERGLSFRITDVTTGTATRPTWNEETQSVGNPPTPILIVKAEVVK